MVLVAQVHMEEDLEQELLIQVEEEKEQLVHHLLLVVMVDLV